MHEKYGVEQEEQSNEKRAGEETCPVCQRPVEIHGNTRLCPVHGSKPFERK